MSTEKLLLLDFDGTLISSVADFTKAWNMLLQHYDKPTVTEEHMRMLVSQGSRQLINMHFDAEPGSEAFNELRELYFDFYKQTGYRKSVLMEGMHDIIESAKSKGIKWGIATNRFKRLMGVLDSLNLAPDCVFCSDDVPASKPAPDMILAALRETNTLPENCLYVGDDRVDQEASVAANVAFAAATWGYSVGTIDENEVHERSGDIWALSPNDLLQWIDG